MKKLVEVVWKSVRAMLQESILRIIFPLKRVWGPNYDNFYPARESWSNYSPKFSIFLVLFIDFVYEIKNANVFEHIFFYEKSSHPELALQSLSFRLLEISWIRCLVVTNLLEKLRWKDHWAAGIYLLKVNNSNTRARWEICSKLTTGTPERRHWLW